MKFSKLYSFIFLALALCVFSAPANGQEQKDENCRRLTADGECVDMKLTLLGDGDPRQMPIILFSAPDVSEAQARELIQLFTPVLVKEFGQQIAIVTEERQIPRSWQGRRYVLTYRVRVSPVASTLEPVKAKKVAARKGAEFGRDMIDVLIQALPGNGRIASRAKGKAAEGAREVAQDQIDRTKLGQQGRDRTYAVTAELLRGDGSLFKAIKPTTKYFVVREVYNTQANRIDFYLIGEGERRDQIVERDELIYLGYTFDGSVEALTEQMFLTLIRQGGAVTRYLRDPERLDSIGTNPATPPPGFMPECKELFWKAAEDAKTGRWVCKDQPAKAQQPACPTGTLKRDSSGDWRCVAEAPAPLVQQDVRSAMGTTVPAASTTTPDPWANCPQAQRRMEGAHHVCAAPGETVDLSGMQSRPVSPPIAVPAPPATPAIIAVGAMFNLPLSYKQGQTTPKMRGPQVTAALALLANTGYLPCDGQSDPVWGPTASGVANPQIGWPAFERANVGKPGLTVDGEFNDFEFLNGLARAKPELFQPPAGCFRALVAPAVVPKKIPPKKKK